VFLLVPAHPGSPGQRAIKRLLLLLLMHVNKLIYKYILLQFFHCELPFLFLEWLKRKMSNVMHMLIVRVLAYEKPPQRGRGQSHVTHFISERELTFTFAICYRRPSVCRLSSVTLVRPTQAVEIFRNISTAFGTLAIH